MSTVLTVPVRAPSATPLLLRRARVALVLLTLLVGGTALLVTWKEHTVVVVAGDHTATAVTQAYAASQALADADSQAVHAISRGAGPGGQYQADIAAAEQSLEQVAEDNGAGATGSAALQLIEGLLPAYTGLVEEADAHFRMQVSGESGVGVEYLWSASELMHQQILTEQDILDSLPSTEQSALAAQQSSPWVSPWLNATWMVLALALLGTLAATQYLLYRRSRRMLSKYLTVAAAAVIALCVTTSRVIPSEHSLSAMSGPLSAVMALQVEQEASTDGAGQTTLRQLMRGACGQCSAEEDEITGTIASDTKARIVAQSAAPACHGGIPGCVVVQESLLARDAATAQAAYVTSMAFIAGLTILLLLLIPLGLRRPLDEYRYG